MHHIISIPKVDVGFKIHTYTFIDTGLFTFFFNNIEFYVNVSKSSFEKIKIPCAAFKHNNSVNSLL